MASFDDVRRIALTLPEVVADESATAFRVAGKLFAWPWLERVEKGKARVPNLSALGVRVASEMDKQALIEMDSTVFFTEPHYEGWPAVLIHLEAIDEAMLEKVIGDAWRIQAPKRLSRQEKQ